MSEKSESGESARERVPKGWRVKFARTWGYLRLFPANLCFWLRARRVFRRVGAPYQPHEIPADFFGINVSAGDTPAHDDYVIARLRELGLRSVRVDYGYCKQHGEHAGRLIDRLHAEGFSVLLHLVQPMAEASDMGRRKADRRWCEFVEETLTRFAGKLDAVELGSTINRFRWAGYAMTGYVRAARLAARICRERGVTWCGPNVTDFSPLTNIGVLGLLRGKRALPDVHTNNLFVDRAGQPENYDPKVGSRLSRRLDLGLTNKARWLAGISRYFGVARTFSPYSYWTLNTKQDRKPRYVEEDQYANYLVRYLTMTAAGGYLDRVYWGQMISHLKGLIDDGVLRHPVIPAPHHTWRLRGEPENYAPRPAFSAFATLIGQLRGARFCRRLPTFGGTYLFEFERPADAGEGEGEGGERLLIGWTRDGMRDDCLERLLAGRAGDVTRMENIAGQELRDGVPPLTPVPVYVAYRGAPLAAAAEVEDGGYLARTIVPLGGEEGAYQAFQAGRLRGIVRSDLLTPELRGMLADPELLFEQNGTRTIKESARGCLAEIPLPGAAAGAPTAILKRFNPKRSSFRGARSRATRGWCNSTKIFELGVATPRPLLSIEDSREPARRPSYLLTEKVEGVVQVRQMLKAFRKGVSPPVDVPRDAFIRQLAQFIYYMHRRDIFHRDLTGGNIVLRRGVGQTPTGEERIDFTLIDTARARFYRQLGLLRQHRDLARVGLAPEDRWPFYYAYQRGNQRRLRAGWWRYRLVGTLYRIKYNLKKPSRWGRALRGARKAFSSAERGEDMPNTSDANSAIGSPPNCAWLFMPLRLLGYLLVLTGFLGLYIWAVEETARGNFDGFDLSDLLKENQLLEWSQVGLLGLSILLLLGAFRRGGSLLHRLLAGLLAIAALREFDKFFEHLVHEDFYKVLGGLVTLVLAVGLWRGRERFVREVPPFLKRPGFYLMFFSVALVIVIAQVFGKRDIWAILSPELASESKRFVEEGLELVGYLLIGFGVIEERFFTKRGGPDAERGD